MTLRLTVAEIEQPSFEAQLLIGLALGVSRSAVLAGTMPEPTHEQTNALESLIAERERHVPLAYLRGDQEFYGLRFRVTPAVLIPRPETELLVDFARERLASRAKPRFVDVGTGSGCIPISLLHSLPQAEAVATDISREAIAVAQQNAHTHSVAERLLLLQTNLLQGVEGEFDLILSNPPYIPTKEISILQPEVRNYEPRLALDGGEEGIELIRELLSQCGRNLSHGGWIALEVARGQSSLVESLMRAEGLQNVGSQDDLARIPRLVFGQKP